VGATPALVVTPPPKRRGREGTATSCPVAAAAAVLGIPVHPSEDVNDASTVGAIHARRPALLVVVAFGQILRKEIRSLPRLGTLNLHFSLLPRWRGAAPVQRCIESGDEVTGVTVQRLVARLDAGPVVARREEEIRPGERAGELEDRLADLGAALLADVVGHTLETGILIEGKPQKEREVTAAPKIRKEEGVADFSLDPDAFCRRARALHPWPLVRAGVKAGPKGEGKGKSDVVTLHRVRPGKGAPGGKPSGTVLSAGKAGIEVACGRSSVVLLELQRPGAKVLDAAAFLNGFPLEAGDRFGSPMG